MQHALNTRYYDYDYYYFIHIYFFYILVFCFNGSNAVVWTDKCACSSPFTRRTHSVYIYTIHVIGFSIRFCFPLVWSLCRCRYIRFLCGSWKTKTVSRQYHTYFIQTTSDVRSLAHFVWCVLVNTYRSRENDDDEKIKATNQTHFTSFGFAYVVVFASFPILLLFVTIPMCRLQGTKRHRIELKPKKGTEHTTREWKRYCWYTKPANWKCLQATSAKSHWLQIDLMITAREQEDSTQNSTTRTKKIFIWNQKWTKKWK